MLLHSLQRDKRHRCHPHPSPWNLPSRVQTKLLALDGCPARGRVRLVQLGWYPMSEVSKLTQVQLRNRGGTLITQVLASSRFLDTLLLSRALDTPAHTTPDQKELSRTREQEATLPTLIPQEKRCLWGGIWESAPKIQNAKAVRTSCCRGTVEGGHGDQVDLVRTGRGLTPGKLASLNLQTLFTY